MGNVDATLVTLLASCELHGLEPRAYVQDLVCLSPSWNQLRVLEPTPGTWASTVSRPDVQPQLEKDAFREAAFGVLEPTEQAAAAS